MKERSAAGHRLPARPSVIVDGPRLPVKEEVTLSFPRFEVETPQGAHSAWAAPAALPRGR